MKRLLTLLSAIAFAGQAWAESFTFGNLKYTVIDSANRYVSVSKGEVELKGELNILATATNNHTLYLVTTIDNYAFNDCGELTSVIIPNSVTSIGNGAFNECNSLTSVVIGDSVKSIGNYTFVGCSSLTSVTIPNSVTSIGNGAFNECNSLTSVTIGNSVTNIGDNAFYGCSKLVEINVAKDNADYYSENGVLFDVFKTTIICYPAGKTETTYTIPNSVYYIDDYAFYGCRVLTTVTIPNPVEYIGEFAFSGCSGLTSVSIPYSVTYICQGAFSDCSSLTSVSIPESVTIIDEYTFYACSSLTSVSLPNSIKWIKEGAFEGCIRLPYVTIPDSVEWIADYAFYDVVNIVYSGNAKGSPWGAYYMNPTIDTEGFIYADAEKTKLTAYIGNDTEITIPNTVRFIGYFAFYGRDSLKTVYIPNTVKDMRGSAFEGCTATIYCDFEKKPDLWDDWYVNDYKGKIVWKTATPVTETAANAVSIYAYGRSIVVENAAEEISVYDAMGRLVCRDAAHHVSTITVNGTGAYIVKVGDVVKRVVVR